MSIKPENLVEPNRESIIRFLKTLEGGIEVKICILELLRLFGVLHVSILHKYLKERMGMEISIVTLHRYIRQMIEAGILKGERGKRFNILFVSIPANIFPYIKWLFAYIGDVQTSPEYMKHLSYYFQTVKPHWKNVTIKFWGNKTRTLAQYAPLLSLMLAASAIDPYKQIEIFDKIGKEVCINTSEEIEISIGQITKVVEDELEKISPFCKEIFLELQSNEDAKKFREMVEEYLAMRNIYGFATVIGPVDEEARARREEDFERQKKIWHKVWEDYISPIYES